jgi:glycosyltransferase involved in cell wall biosynthesis
MNLLSYVHLRNIYRSTGVGRVARELTEHLALLPGVNVEVLADPGDHCEIVHKVGEPWTGFRYHFMQHETSRQQELWYFLNRPTAESYWPQAELVYCTAESYVPVRRARLAVSCHDTQHFEPGAHKMSLWLLKQRFKWNLLFGRLAAKADMFHMISYFAAERTAHFFPAIKSRLRVVPNAASESFFNPPTGKGKEVLAQLGLAGRPYVLVPGGLHHRKNAELILDAWPHIHRRQPDLTLVVINHSDPAYVDRANALAPSLILAGYQEEEPLVALYNAAQLVWFPTRYDGFGMPVIEAMACGAPVVSSNSSAIPEIAGEAATLLAPDKIEDHVDVICRLIEDGSAREKFSQLGRARAQRYRWATSARQLAENFAALL